MATLAETHVALRHRIRVAGVVQGVGFRPFVHRLATELDLAGHVGNDTEGVFAEVEGGRERLERFAARLAAEAPPLARIDRIETTVVPLRGVRGFRIVESHVTSPVRTFVSPDVAVCADCLRELFDPDDRRYRYPFVNCTNCGPRFTITVRLPYDRPNTTMGGFALCPECDREYHDPADRRFHAQPVACAVCGPSVWFERSADCTERAAGVIEGTDDALAAAHLALAGGRILAVKGIGGYHLACDATDEGAIASLRRRKGRRDKPFAVMVGSLAVARRVARVDPAEAALLASPQAPIVLVRRSDHGELSEQVAPGSPYVGLLLPYTPVHHLLFRPVPGRRTPVPEMVVMTSGNLSEEPICYEPADARRRLARIADAWLDHDRPIHVPCDDSVVRVEAGEELPVRRSRGYAPLPIRLPFHAPPLLAAGGELKNTFCMASGPDAWMSQHIGDMGSVETLAAFERSTRQFAGMYDVEPERVVADAHPGYQVRRWADERLSGPAELVQHHHAHIAALMAEHGVSAGDKVIGVAFDGTGYGTDGAIWGGEVLLAGYRGFERAAHLRYVPLAGGDAAIRKPYRAALAHLRAAGIGWDADLAPVRAATTSELTMVGRQLERGVRCVPTSSMGRLFDAVSSLLDVCHVVSYEAQAATELEAVATPHLDTARHYRFAVSAGKIDPAPVLQSMVDDLRHGCPVGPIAAGFHRAVASMLAGVAAGLRATTGIDRVALSGGVFQNVVLLRLARDELLRRRLQVLTHRLVPPNDGGLALGQAAVAACLVAAPGSG